MAKKDTTSDVSGDLGTSELKAKVDEATEQGFRGVKVDPTPNESYTVAGVTRGLPTPETNAEAQEAARGATNTNGESLRQVAEANKATLEAAAANGLDTSSRQESEGQGTGVEPTEGTDAEPTAGSDD